MFLIEMFQIGKTILKGMLSLRSSPIVASVLAVKFSPAPSFPSEPLQHLLGQSPRTREGHPHSQFYKRDTSHSPFP